jgi:putative hydrolase of the HAD superfamily
LLIIFDLDDTLIDTSGSLIPMQLKSALRSMKERGVDLPQFDEAFDVLLRLNRVAKSSKEALEEFFEINGINPLFLNDAVSCVYDQVPETFSIEPHEFALELLQILSELHKIALVTMGHEGFQRLKMEKAGIDTRLFSKIVVTPYKNKKVIYKEMMQELDLDASEVVVCGDRIENDLTPAKELGCKTVHMRQGRGRCSPAKHADVDFSISHLSELLPLLPKMSNLTNIIGNTLYDNQ